MTATNPVATPELGETAIEIAKLNKWYGPTFPKWPAA